MSQLTMFNTPLIHHLLRSTSRIILRLSGWQVVGNVGDDLKQCILIAVPHTSNWDMPTSLMIAFALDTELQWVGKSSIFKFPLGPVMRWMGGIAVDRSQSQNMVAATIEKFKEYPKLRIMMAPEGTRSRVKQWKTGFYHIAHGAQIPIALGFVDYKNKRGGIGGVFHTTGNYDQDLADIMKFYQPLVDRIIPDTHKTR